MERCDICGNICNFNDSNPDLSYLNTCKECGAGECDNCLLNHDIGRLCCICEEYLCIGCVVNPSNRNTAFIYCRKCIDELTKEVLDKLKGSQIIELNIKLNNSDLQPKCIFDQLDKTKFKVYEMIQEMDKLVIYNHTNINLCIDSFELTKDIELNCFKKLRYPCLNCLLAFKYHYN